MFTCMNQAMNCKQKRLRAEPNTYMEAEVNGTNIPFHSGQYVVLGTQWSTLKTFTKADEAHCYKQLLLKQSFPGTSTYAYVGKILETEISWDMR